MLRGRVIAEFDNPFTRGLVRLYRPFVHFALSQPAITLTTAALALASCLPIRDRDPPDRLDAIFDEFTQADQEIGKKYGGTGLGLTIGRRLAALLGGALEVESDVGRGSTFRFRVRLPTGASQNAT